MNEEYIPRKSALQAIYTSTAPALEVKAIPAADVVEVVRCRECRFIERGSQFDLSGEGHETASFCSVVGFPPDDDWYCADGKRRDGGQHDGA